MELCKGNGKQTDGCFCWRCARRVTHKAEGQPVCDCGAKLGEPGTVTLCSEGLMGMTDSELEFHIEARKQLGYTR